MREIHSQEHRQDDDVGVVGGSRGVDCWTANVIVSSSGIQADCRLISYLKAGNWAMMII